MTVLEVFSSAFDFRAAQQQLGIVTGEDDPVIDFRFLPESPNLHRKRAQMTREQLAKTRLNLRGRLSNPAIRRTLQKKNLAGYGIFFLTNVSDGVGRKKENIVAGRCLVLDLDRSPLPPTWVLQPHWIQETSPGRHQCFLAIEPTTDLAGCEDVSRRLAAHYGGDLAVCDISHVFRLAGFCHLKRGRFPVRVVAQNDFDPRHKLADFEFLPRLPPKASVPASTGPGLIDAAKAALLFAEMDVTKLAGNQAWLDYAMSLHAASRGDPEVRDLFLDWCAADPKYADEAFALSNRSRWDSFKLDRPTLKGVGTLKKLSRAYGAHDTTLHAVFDSAAEDFNDEMEADSDSSEDDSWMDGPSEPEPMLWDLNNANEMLADVESRMLRHGAPLYQAGGRLVYPVRSVRASTDEDAVRRPAGALTIHDVKSPRLTLFMIKHGRFVRQTKRANSGDPQFVKQPANKNLAELYLSAPDQWNVPSLTGIIETPTLRDDGTLLTEPGYDRQSGLLLDMGGARFPTVPDHPSRDEACVALELLKRPFVDFPFVRDDRNNMSASRSVMLSAALTALVRRSLPAAPMHGVSAPTPGTGKSLAIQVVSMIAMGRKLTAMSQGASDEEDQKRLFSVLMQGDQMVSIDNCTRAIGGDALCTILTEPTWQNRVLGESRNVSVQTNVLLTATGNNLTFAGDMTRRAVLCRMDAGLENPEGRSFDVDLPTWVPQHRTQLVAAGLTILRVFVCAGRPGLDRLKPFGSFEAWSNLVRGALVWLGEPDPCITRKHIAADDPVRAQLAAFFAAIHRAMEDRWFNAGELLNKSFETDGLSDIIFAAVAKANPLSLGRFLKANENKIIGGMTLRSRYDGHQKSWLYSVKEA